MKIVLPLGRSLDKAIQYLEKHYDIGEAMFYRRPKRQYIYKTYEHHFVFIKPKDIMIYCKEYDFDIAFVGSDVYIDEELSSKSNFKQLGTTIWGVQKLSLISAHDAMPSNISKIYTPYVNIAKKYYPNIEIVKADSSLEIYPCENKRNAIIDIIETGTTMQIHDLVEMNTVFNLELICFSKGEV